MKGRNQKLPLGVKKYFGRRKIVIRGLLFVFWLLCYLPENSVANNENNKGRHFTSEVGEGVEFEHLLPALK